MLSSPSINSITRAAARLRVAVFAAMAVMLGLYLAARFGLQFGHAHVEYEVHGLDSPLRRAMADGSVLLLMIALYQLARMLRGVAAGDLFGPRVVARFRSFALWLLIMSLVDLVAPFIAEVAQESRSGLHQIRLSLDFRELLTVAVTLLLFILARLLERARLLDEEMREIV